MPTIVLDVAGPTRSSLVESAYDFCGLSGDQYERTPEELSKGLRLLNSLMASLKTLKGIDLGYDAPTYGEGLLEEPSGIPDGAREPVAALLAQRLAPTIGASLTDDAKAVLATAYQDLLAQNVSAPPSRIPTNHMRTLNRLRRISPCICPGRAATSSSPAPTATPTPVVTPPVVTPPPSAPTLVDLTLSTSSISENAPAGTVVGQILGMATGSVLSLTDNAENRFAVSQISGVWYVVAGSTNIDYDTATGGASSYPITILETNTVSSTTVTHSTTITIQITNVLEVTLGTLTGSFSVPENSAVGTIVGTPTGFTTGSNKLLTVNGNGAFAIDPVSGQITVADGTKIDYETATSISITVRELHPDGINSPNDTVFSVGVINQNDTNPNAFSFTPATGVALGALETSNTITIAGMGAADTCIASLSGDATSRLSKNGGAYVTGPLSVVNGDTVTVRHTASASYSTTVSTTLTIGTTSATYSSTTLAASGLSALSIAFDTADGWTTGQNPPAIALTLPVDGSVTIGDWYQIEYANNNAFTGSTLSSWNQITSDDIENSADGPGFDFVWGTPPSSGLTYFRAWAATDNAGTGKSPASNIISDTLSSAGATVILTGGIYGSGNFDKSKMIVVSSPFYQWVQQGFVGSQTFVRGTKAAIRTQFYTEWLLNGWNSNASVSAVWFGFDDRSVDLNRGGVGTIIALPGNASGGPGITFETHKAGTTIRAWCNGSSQTLNLTGVTGGFAVGDRIGIESDTTAHTHHVFHIRGATVVDLGTITLTSQIPSSVWPIAGSKDGNGTAADGSSDCGTFQPDPTQWTRTPNATFNHPMA